MRNIDEMLNWAKSVHHSTERTLNSYKQGAAIRNYAFEISDQEADKLFRSRCAYCRYQPESRFNGIDRIDNKVGYVPGNVVACCLWCNRAKGRNAVGIFLKWLQWVQSGAAADLKDEDFIIPAPSVPVVEWDSPPIEQSSERVPTPLYEPVNLRGLTPSEYVHRQVWDGKIEPPICTTQRKPRVPKAIPLPPKPEPPVAVSIPVPPKPKPARIPQAPKRIRVLRAHDFRGGIRVSKEFRRGGSGKPS